MTMLRWGIWWISLWGVLTGCQSSVTPTVTLAVFPSATPSPTATLTPTTPAPILDDFSLVVSVQDEITLLPADTLTTVAVSATLTAPESVDTSALDVQFQAFGGGTFVESSIDLVDGVAQAQYTTGETATRTDVELQATLDIPQIGRVSGSNTITLVRETLSLEVSQRQVALVDGAAPVIFSIENQEPDVRGQYRISVPTRGAGQFLQAGETLDLATAFEVGTPNRLTYTYMPPEDVSAGVETYCLGIANRPVQEDVCGHVLWGTTGDTLDVRIAQDALWGQGTIAEMRVGLLADDVFVESVGSLCYQLLVPPADMPPVLLEDWETEDALSQHQCVTVDLLANGYQYIGFRPHQALWVMQWSLYAPGIEAPVTYDVVVARARLQAQLTEERLALAEDDSLWLTIPSGADAPFFYSEVDINTVDASSTAIPVLFGVYVPTSALVDGALVGTESIPVRTQRDSETTLMLGWGGVPPTILHLGDIHRTNNNNSVTESWQLAYLGGNVVADILSQAIINQ